MSIDAYTLTDIFKAPAFVVNLDRCQERLATCLPRIAEAGFKNLQRWKGTDACDADMSAFTAHLTTIKFNSSDDEFCTSYPGKRGCFLSHINLWKHIMDSKIPLAVVFEDDVRFHKDWATLAPRYWDSTPKDFHIMYMGSQMDAMRPEHITIVPVFCTHAYVITLAGATHLYNLLLNDPCGVRTIDCMLIDHMKAAMYDDTPPAFTWYVWNGTMFPDQFVAEDRYKKRNTGIVFQDPMFVSDVRPEW